MTNTEMNATTQPWPPSASSTYQDVGLVDLISGSTNQSIEGGTFEDNLLQPNLAIIRFRDDSRFWVQRVLLPIVETIGIFGNVVTILVLTRKGMRSSTNAYLTALAITDLAYLLSVFWLSLQHYPNLKGSLFWANFYAYSLPYSLWLTDATTNTSVWLTVTFTVERCIAVCLPIKGRVWCTESRAKKLIVVVCMICFTATLTTPFEWTVAQVMDSVTNVTKTEMMPSQLGNDETYRSIYYWFTIISFVLVPLTLLIIFNSFLIYSVRQSNKLRQVMTARQGNQANREERAATNEIKITTTLIAVVIMFLICQLPTAGTLLYNLFHQPEPESDEEVLLQGLGNIFNFLVALNAAGNFLLYCAFSDKYRRTFIQTFCKCFAAVSCCTENDEPGVINENGAVSRVALSAIYQKPIDERNIANLKNVRDRQRIHAHNRQRQVIQRPIQTIDNTSSLHFTGDAAQNRFGRKLSSIRLNANDGSASVSQSSSKVRLSQQFSINGDDDNVVTHAQITSATDVFAASNLQDDHNSLETATTHQEPSLKTDFDVTNLV